MKANKLIQEYKVRGHPLGEELKFEEAEILLNLLRQRLNTTERDLDLAPYSLKRLEHHLHDYYRFLKETDKTLSDDEVVELVREIAAYLGCVLVKHSDAIWRGGNSLWETFIQLKGSVKVIKGGKSYEGKNLNYLLGNQAAAAWDRITENSHTRLYSVYLSMRKRVVSQKLR